jgi:hypothetical protein
MWIFEKRAAVPETRETREQRQDGWKNNVVGPQVFRVPALAPEEPAETRVKVQTVSIFPQVSLDPAPA